LASAASTRATISPIFQRRFAKPAAIAGLGSGQVFTGARVLVLDLARSDIANELVELRGIADTRPASGSRSASAAWLSAAF
jgi:hypothetical protein